MHKCHIFKNPVETKKRVIEYTGNNENHNQMQIKCKNRILMMIYLS